MFKALFSIFKRHQDDPFPTLAKNDRLEEIPEGMSEEQFFLLNEVYAKRDEMTAMFTVLAVTNQVPADELEPYDSVLLGESAILFKTAFSKLAEAVGGSFARDED